MAGTKGKMENFALPMANAPNINTHKQRMGLALVSLASAEGAYTFQSGGMAVKTHHRHIQTLKRVNNYRRAQVFEAAKSAFSRRHLIPVFCLLKRISAWKDGKLK